MEPSLSPEINCAHVANHIAACNGQLAVWALQFVSCQSTDFKYILRCLVKCRDVDCMLSVASALYSIPRFTMPLVNMLYENGEQGFLSVAVRAINNNKAGTAACGTFIKTVVLPRLAVETPMESKMYIVECVRLIAALSANHRLCAPLIDIVFDLLRHHGGHLENAMSISPHEFTELFAHVLGNKESTCTIVNFGRRFVSNPIHNAHRVEAVQKVIWFWKVTAARLGNHVLLLALLEHFKTLSTEPVARVNEILIAAAASCSYKTFECIASCRREHVLELFTSFNTWRLNVVSPVSFKPFFAFVDNHAMRAKASMYFTTLLSDVIHHPFVGHTEAVKMLAVICAAIPVHWPVCAIGVLDRLRSIPPSAHVTTFVETLSNFILRQHRRLASILARAWLRYSYAPGHVGARRVAANFYARVNSVPSGHSHDVTLVEAFE